MATAQTAKTQYITAATGTTFAYRQLGLSSGIPLLMHIHFRANMDFWDPVLLNGLAASRPVLIFDQAGVGRSTGSIPTTFQGWADDLISFTEALGLKQIDLLGFSMGGGAVQMAALTKSNLIRKLILTGTYPSTPSGPVPGIIWPQEVAPPDPIRVLATAVSPEEVEHALAYSFFYDDTDGRAAAKAYWNRIHERSVPDEPLLLNFVDRYTGAKNQMIAASAWKEHNPQNSFDRLGKLKMPVLVMNGDDDVLIPTSRSWELMKGIANAQLIIYPEAGHGFLYQYAKVVAAHINMFLDGDEYGASRSKL